jgi:FtsP/CotA-like multicopper oxidase with cupredoxin domain
MPCAHSWRAAPVLLALLVAAWAGPVQVRAAPPGAIEDACARPAPGSDVSQPPELKSRNGVLKLDLQIRSYRSPDGSVRYCYRSGDAPSPTLRLHPGDLLELRLKNELTDLEPASSAMPGMKMTPAAPGAEAHERGAERADRSDPCDSLAMTGVSTNLHFHGLTVPARCHEDEVLKTSIQPGDPAFEYRFRIPENEPPGLYWYHPHIHGFSSRQVMGGASGALIIEGIERAVPQLAGLPERVLVIRDQDLLNPDAPPSKSEPVVPHTLIDRDGDSANNGTGFGRPAKDLSINFVPVPWPDYPPARIRIKPGARELWRVVNASAITYLNLALIFGRAPQQLGLVGIDGVPMNASGHTEAVTWVNHIGVPPGARVEFIVNGPGAGVPALFVTRTVDTGQGGENDPNRALASIVAAADATEPPALPAEHDALPVATQPWLADVPPVRVRRLYFSEQLDDPNDPNTATTFFITVDGQTPKAFDPADGPNIVATQGDVEDWIIENRSTELHAFHIHQLHFMLVAWNGQSVNEPFLRDTVNVPYFNGRMLQYPSVTVRMDFRDPDTVGTFVYHCHLLEHEDAGMMGTIRVDPRPGAPSLPHS